MTKVECRECGTTWWNDGRERVNVKGGKLGTKRREGYGKNKKNKFAGMERKWCIKRGT